jgi:DNA-binding NarL/FixJ family response regulator
LDPTARRVIPDPDDVRVAMSRRVLVVDDHALLVQTLLAALAIEGHEAVAVSSLDPATVLDEAERFAPDLVLLDLDLGADAGSGLALVVPLRALGSLVVMMTGEQDPRRLAECVEAGAEGIVPKSGSFDELLAGIDAAFEGRLLPANRRQELVRELARWRAADRDRLAPFERLTQREREVLASLMGGQSAERIAADAVVSLATVRSQIRAILAKLGVNSQLSAVALARRAGWDLPAAEPGAPSG